MTGKDLKTIFDLIAIEYGFKKQRYMYVRDFDDFVLRVSLQNSLDGDDYCFYCYFLIKAIHTQSALESFLTADITGQQCFITENGNLESIQLKDFYADDISKIIRDSMDSLIKLIENNGVQSYLKKYPEYIRTIPMRSKEYLKNQGIIE